MSKHLKYHVTKLVEAAGLPATNIREDGGCALRIRGLNVHISYLEQSDEVLFVCPLRDIPLKDNEKLVLYEKILTNNIRMANHGTIGINGDTFSVIYADKKILANCSEIDFAKGLKTFVERAEHLFMRYENILTKNNVEEQTGIS